MSPAEKVRLERHVEACSVCRFERQVRDDFRLEFAVLGKAARKEKSERRRQPFGYRAASGTRLPKVRMSSRVRFVLLAAAATLVASAAAAEWETIKRTVFSSAVVEQSRAHIEAPFAPKDAPKAGATIAAPAAEPGAIDPMLVTDHPKVDSVTAPLGDDTAKDATKGPVKSPTREATQPSLQRQAVAAPAAASATTESVEPAAAPPEQPPLTAETLFASANEERERGAYGEAVRLYRDLSQRFPQSAEATTAHAIVGRLLLDRGDPSGALVQFDDYLQSGMTTLGEEAGVGRALSLQRLGRSTEEAEAWTTLLSTYPQSVHASRARSRLAALGNR